LIKVKKALKRTNDVIKKRTDKKQGKAVEYKKEDLI